MNFLILFFARSTHCLIRKSTRNWTVVSTGLTLFPLLNEEKRNFYFRFHYKLNFFFLFLKNIFPRLSHSVLYYKSSEWETFYYYYFVWISMFFIFLFFMKLRIAFALQRNVFWLWFLIQFFFAIQRENIGELFWALFGWSFFGKFRKYLINLGKFCNFSDDNLVFNFFYIILECLGKLDSQLKVWKNL